MNEEQVKRHLWQSFLEWMRNKEIYFHPETGQDIFDIKDVGQFVVYGMRGEERK